jgi:hypothetical protein
MRSRRKKAFEEARTKFAHCQVTVHVPDAAAIEETRSARSPVLRRAG